jgi:hypothetical protein
MKEGTKCLGRSCDAIAKQDLKAATTPKEKKKILEA